jgi:hypothetical protein
MTAFVDSRESPCSLRTYDPTAPRPAAQCKKRQAPPPTRPARRATPRVGRLSGFAFGAANVTVDQRMRELPLPGRKLQPVRLEFVRAGAPDELIAARVGKNALPRWVINVL